MPPLVVFKCPYLKGRTKKNAKHLAHYVDYIATRDGADTETLRREGYLRYIAHRPHVEKVGRHGLFSDSDDQIVLARLIKEITLHRGNIWQPMISLAREDAIRLGYDNAKQWRDFLRSYANDLAEGLKIKPENFRWYAAYHDHEVHPHVHMVCWSANPREGYLSKSGIEIIKSGIVRQIFRQDLLQIYSEQTTHREALNRESLALMRKKCAQMRSDSCDNPQIELLIHQLANRLSKTGGKKVYGYLKADVKSIVDNIVDELEKDPHVAVCYAAWYDMREQILRTYADTMPERLPLSRQKEFKPIKNMIIREAMQIITPMQTASPSVLPAATKLLRELSKLFEDHQQQLSARADHIDRKRMRELHEKKQEQGHAQDEQVLGY